MAAVGSLYYYQGVRFRVLALDGPPATPVVGMNYDTKAILYYTTAQEAQFTASANPVIGECYLNLFQNGTSQRFATLTEAINAANQNFVARIKVTWDTFPGVGL